MICDSVSPPGHSMASRKCPNPASKTEVIEALSHVLVQISALQHRMLPPIPSLTRKNHSGRGLGSFLTFHPYIYNRIPAAFQARHAFPLHLSLCLSLPKACLSTPRTKYSQTPRLCMHYTGCRFPPLPSHLPSPVLSSSGAPRRGGRGGRGRR